MLLHHVRIEPYTHGIGLRAEAGSIAHTLDTLQGRYQVNGIIVGQELVIVTTIRGQRIHKNL